MSTYFIYNSPSSAPALGSSSTSPDLLSHFIRPLTPPAKPRTSLWHGLPSPNTPCLGDVFSRSLTISSEKAHSQESCKSPADHSWHHDGDMIEREGIDDESVVASAKEPTSAVSSSRGALQRNEQLAQELEASSSPTTARRSTRLRKQIISYNLSPTPPVDNTKVVKSKAKIASAAASTDSTTSLELTITPAIADPIPFEGLPALRSLDWELQYPPGGSTHPSYPYPTLDPRLIFCQPFVPVIDGLPDFSRVPKLSLPIGWRQVTWCGLLPVVFDPYRQAFKLTPVGPLPLTCEELQQGGLQKYVPGGELHPETALLPEMMRLSDGSVDDVFNWEGVDWTLPWGDHKNTDLVTSWPAEALAFNKRTSLQNTNGRFLTIVSPWREARDCPNMVLDVDDGWRWLSGKEQQPEVDFIPLSAKRPRNGAYRTYRKIKSPIPELMMGANLAEPDDASPVLQNQDTTSLNNIFCPYKSVATPMNVDITLLADTEFTLMELLSYFPQHYNWGHAAERLSRAGIQPSMIRNLVNMTRALEGETALKLGSVSHAVTTAKKRDVIQQEDLSKDNIAEKESTTEQKLPSSDAKDTTTKYTAEGWTYNVWSKTDYPLLALAHGLQELPTGPDAGPLTSLIHWCRKNKRYRVLLSNVPALLKEAGIEPLIEPSDDGCPDKDVAARHNQALRRDYYRVKRSLDAVKREAEDEQDGRRKKRKLNEIIE
ncbi:hypothetical protein T440DRAFT_533130 [Plenodomus tracheiphilus IPT5]|uniref:Uncharacterized protein n=1 Tax=Plenodomus tracheiphilus IPT5 TaxID=1408161 RepID=A0A6A7B5J9_9PLEO|nr:hypothetical protein T440DRAFT_533130 [Plenodomus tracheiphilus IPT5]